MKRASGKSNLSIIKDYVEGNRPFVQISMSGAEDLKKRKEGEEWEDGSGKRWKKQNGKKVGINNIKTKVLDAVKKIHICKICGSDTRFSSKKMSRFDNQTIFMTGKCYECFIEFETMLKASGIYEKYIRRRDLLNLKSALLDFKAKIEETINWCDSPSSKKIESLNDTGPNSVELDVEYDNTDYLDRLKLDAIKDLGLANDRLTDIEKELISMHFDENKVKNIDKILNKKYKNGRNTSEFSIKILNKV
jgi:hypothetical protein